MRNFRFSGLDLTLLISSKAWDVDDGNIPGRVIDTIKKVQNGD